MGIFQEIKSSSVVFTPSNGVYQVYADDKLIFSCKDLQLVKLTAASYSISINYQGKNYTANHKVRFLIDNWDSNFELKSIIPKHRKQTYDDNLIVKHRKGKLVLINEIHLEKYVSGVVEAEAGARHTREYYKAQAIISRTYALAHKRRHEAQGFHLCDQVHCQAYHGKSIHDENIILGAFETKDLVLVDHHIELITAAFHSNCGGQTINAEDAWSSPLPYLVSRKDTFCLVMPHSHWEKTIPKDKWTRYLNEKSDLLASIDSDSSANMNWFPEEKQLYFLNNNKAIPNKEIRMDLGLRSAWFTVLEEDETVLLTGRGFGHGVGLCQEGAMKMAQLGYSYSDILHFYYKDVHLIDRQSLDFFLE